MNEMQTTTCDTARQTPIEIALGIDGEGMTTATKLYEFLELNPSNYAKWFKKNITQNQFAEENVDFTRFVLKYESGTGLIKERQDAKLTANFAKKLSMVAKSPKGEAARDYFIGTEKALKRVVATQQLPELDRLKVQVFDLKTANTELLNRLESLEQRQAAIEQKTDTGFTTQERVTMAECFTTLGKILSGANEAPAVKKMRCKSTGVPDMPISSKQLDKIRAAMSECVRRQIAMLDGDYEGNRSAEQILRGDLYKAIRNGIGVKHTEARESQYDEIMRIIDGYWANQKLKDKIYRYANPSRYNR